MNDQTDLGNMAQRIAEIKNEIADLKVQAEIIRGDLREHDVHGKIPRADTWRHGAVRALAYKSGLIEKNKLLLRSLEKEDRKRIGSLAEKEKRGLRREVQKEIDRRRFAERRFQLLHDWVYSNFPERRSDLRDFDVSMKCETPPG